MFLQARDLVSGYGQLQVLHGVDFHVDAGELVAVLGPNGAGKSTLMRTLARTLPVMSGSITFGGRRIDTWRAPEAAAAGISYVPQERNVFTDLTVRENLVLAARNARSGRRPTDEVFERFDFLRKLEHRPAGLLSGGERQSLAVSMAFLSGPALMLLDEPTTGLAPMAADNLAEWILEIAGSGVSVVWVVEQDPELVMRAAARVYVLGGGRIRHEGKAGEVTGDAAMRILLEAGQ